MSMYGEMYDPPTYVTGARKSKGGGRYHSDSRHEYGGNSYSAPRDSRYPSSNDYGGYREETQYDVGHDGGYNDDYKYDSYDPNDEYGNGNNGAYDDGYDDGYDNGYNDDYAGRGGAGDYDGYETYDEYHDNAPVMRQAPSFPSRQEASTLKQKKKTKTKADRPQTASSGKGLRTSDQAFELTAKLIVDYLSPKLEEGATSYYLDMTDTIFLDAVVPKDIRPDFVDAVAFRTASLTPGGNSPIDSLVRECQRLGLGQKDTFLLGGGEKMADGQIAVHVVQEGGIPKNSSSPSVSSVSTRGTKVQSRPTSGRSSKEGSQGSKIFDLKTSDEAFEVTAKLVVDYLSPKMPNGASSYHLDANDIIFLDAVVPQDIRPGFVEAVAFRTESLTPGEDSPIESLVRECQRLGLNRPNTFLLGGGMKMDDGRILVLPGSMKIGKGKKTKKKKSQKPKAAGNDMTWLAKSGLPPDQMKLIMTAMSADVASKTTSQLQEVSNGDTTKDAAQNEEKIEMHGSRRKRTTKGKVLPPIGAAGAQNRALIPNKKAEHDFIKPSFSNANMSGSVVQSSASNVKVEKEVIGGPPPLKKADSSHPSTERALQRRMRSLERRSKISMYEESLTTPAQATWRDDLWDFTAHGLFHKFLILSFIAPLFALGQIQTRAKLSWLGLPAESVDDVRNIFYNVGSLVAGWLLSNVGLIFTTYWYYVNGVMNTTLLFMMVILNLGFFGFCVIVCANTRWTIRRRSNIPQVFELADYLMALFYLPLVIAQLGRHTADYGQLEARICSATGLSPGVETNDESNYIQPQIVDRETPTLPSIA